MAGRPVKRVVLVPREGSANGGPPESSAPAGPRRAIRRYRLARVAPSPYSALGVDRHERMEEIAERDREG